MELKLRSADLLAVLVCEKVVHRMETTRRKA
jgi:hypothetical protein